MSGIWAALQAFAYATGSVVCHQLPARSFHILGVQLPVCARCTGLYGGGLLGLLVWTGARRVARARLLIGRRPAVTLAASAVPTLLSVASEVLGVWDPANAGRAALALPLGLATGAMLAAVVKGDLR